MKKKIFVLLVFLIFITGCDVKSNIEIFKDLSVVETVSMSGTSSFFNNYYKTLPINVLKKMIDTDSNKKLLDENGYIKANEDCSTNVPGIFVAGDNRVKNVRQLVTATADGAVAVNEAVKYINNL